LRLLVYTDYVYTSSDGAIYAQRAFALFLARLADFVDELVITGRLDPEPAVAHYRLPDKVTFVPLPHYPALSQPTRAIPAMLGSLTRFWRALETVDAAWVLGPYPLSFALVALAAARRRRVVLGVRQDWPRYVRSRHPNSRSLQLVSRAMEAGYRALARVYPIVVVGPQLADNYRRSSAVLPITVSMVEEDEIAPPRDRTGRRALSVGRLETEKNPILLADILAALRRRDARWELVICGEGPLAAALEARLSELGVAGAAQLRGYVPIDAGLHDLYRECDYFLHVSLTEGLPQVIFEAFAARLPIVATAVGGVPDAVGDAALLVPPDDAEAAADALLRLADDGELRRRLVERGVERVRAHTTSSECARIVDFVSNAAR
jgi:glycosyltransferase involved in cell wall biosynthesis